LSIYERLKVLRPSSEEPGNRLQTPTLIGCMLLMNPRHPLDLASRFACFAAISEAFHCDSFRQVLSTWRVSADLRDNRFRVAPSVACSSAEPWILYQLYSAGQQLDQRSSGTGRPLPPAKLRSAKPV